MNTELEVIRNGLAYKYPVELHVGEKCIEFLRADYALKDEIKAMKGARWHGRDDVPRKIWSIQNHPRNVFQLKLMMGENAYAWWERDPIVIQPEDFDRPQYKEYGLPIKPCQIDMVCQALTYRYKILAAEQGLGKSLAAIEIMERSGKQNWWFVGPKSALVSVELEFEKWGLGQSTQINIQMMSYEALVNEMRYNYDNVEWPHGVIFDESSSLKNPTTHRATAAQAVADKIRELHGFEGYVIELSGTPTAKHPTDIWSQAEIAWPGFLKEGSIEAFEKRYAILEDFTNLDGVTLQRRCGWNEEEISHIPDRTQGLMTVYRKADWLDLPEKVFKVIRMEPSKKVQRVQRSLCRVAPNTISALTACRALSSGFQYITKEVGRQECEVCKGTGKYHIPREDICPGCSGTGLVIEYDRETVKVHTPKDDALRDILDDHEHHGRLVVSACFQGSIDRIQQICTERGWACVVVDGRGWKVLDCMGNLMRDKEAMRFWHEYKGKLCFIGNPGSCRFGITLTLAYTIVFYENGFSAEHRLQMIDRIHRMGMSEEWGATIIDFVHLEVDQLTLDTLQENRDTELMSLGAINEYVNPNDEECEEIDEIDAQELLQDIE